MKKKITQILFSFLFIISLNSNAQWAASQGLDGLAVSDIEVFDSIIFLCGSAEGVYYKHINSAYWLNGIPNEGIQSIESTDSALFGLGNYIFVKSTDHGQNWQNVFSQFSMTGTLSTIGNTVIISQNDSLYKSEDQGETWTALNYNFPDFYIYQTITFDTLLFVIDFNKDSILVTADLGNTWNYISCQGLPESLPRYIGDIIVYNDSLYAATKEGVFIYKNIEIGWESRSDGIPEATKIYDLDIFDDTLFCAGAKGIFYFENNEWISDNTGLENTVYVSIKHFQDYQFCGSNWGPFQRNANEPWQPIYQGLKHLDVYCVANYDGTVWACTNKGLFKSTNNGYNFLHMNFEEFNECDQLITTDSIFYLNSKKNGLFISRDFGESWSNISGSLKGNQGIAVGNDYIFFDANDLVRADHINYNWEILPNWLAEANIWEICAKDSIILATVYNDATYSSFDNGISFSKTISSPAYELINWDNKFYAISPYNRLKISEDGMNWIDRPFPNEEWYGSSIVCNSEAIVVAGSLLGLTLYDIMVGITYDGGLTWSEVSTGLPAPNWPIVNHVNIYDNRIFVAPSHKGLWFRDNLLVGKKEEKKSEKLILFVFPNPAESTFQIDFGSLNKLPLIKIFDVKGNVVKVIYNYAQKQQIDISNLSSGLYFLQIIGDNQVVSKKLLKF